MAWSSDNPLIASVDTTITTLENTVTAHKKGIANITVTADGGQVATLVVDVKKVASFTVVDYKAWYDPNDPFELGETKLKVVYDDNKVNPVLIPAKREWIEPYLLNTNWNILSSPNTETKSASERHALKVKYGEVWGSFEVTIRAMRWVTIVGTPARKIYNIGEPFDPKGLQLIASYDIGENVTVELTPEILATAVSVYSAPNNWSRSPGVTVSNKESPAGGKVSPPADPNHGVTYYKNNSTSLTREGVIGPFIYKGMETTERAVNLTTLNGYDAIDGLTVQPFVAKYKDVNGADIYAGADTLPTILEMVRGREATISISSSVSPVDIPNAIPIDLPSSKITLRGFKDPIVFQSVAATPTQMFKVTNGASLKLENITISDGNLSGSRTEPIIFVSGATSNFTLGDSTQVLFGSASLYGLNISNPNAVAGVLYVESGTATIEKGATINLRLGVNGTSLTGTGAPAPNYARYLSTAGILVDRQGTLKMLGGTISGTPAAGSHSTSANPTGVGDVVVIGALELGDNAFIGRLALAANAPVASPLVKINDNWTPISSVILNLTGRATTPDAVKLFFNDKTLFTGKIDTTMDYFSFETTETTGYKSGGFFANVAFGLVTGGSPTNPVLIGTGSGSGNYELKAGKFTLLTN